MTHNTELLAGSSTVVASHRFSRAFLLAGCAFALLFSCSPLWAASGQWNEAEGGSHMVTQTKDGLVLENRLVRCELTRSEGGYSPKFFAHADDGWEEVARGARVRGFVEVSRGDGAIAVPLTQASITGDTREVAEVELSGRTGPHAVTVSLHLREGEKWFHVQVSDRVSGPTAVEYLRTTLAFSPGGRNQAESGPLDSVFTPLLRPADDMVIGQHVFRSPAAVLQKRGYSFALIPDLDLLDKNWRTLPGFLDLDTKSGDARPLVTYGMMRTAVQYHVFYRHDASMTESVQPGVLTFGFYLLLDAQAPPLQAYQEATHFIWQHWGSPLLHSNLWPQVIPFAGYAKYGYDFDFQYIWRDVVLSGEECGGSITGVLGTPGATWFQGWFNNLRTAYGMYIWGMRLGDDNLKAQARKTKRLVLNAPTKEGIFPALYDYATGQWTGYHGQGTPSRNYYHTLDASWTAYWLLRWHEDLEPDQRSVDFCRAYGDFLARVQQPSGAIPSWFDMDTLQPLELFREAAESATSGMFLAELYRVTGEQKYLDAARRCEQFIWREVVPRNKWFDWETFFSCSRKPVDFYDQHTQQYPQNTLSMHWSSELYRVLYLATGEARYLDRGCALLDYLSFYQQAWSPSFLSIYGLGGFGVQNTDAEWNDARQGVFATTYLDYYSLTGNPEYFERGIAALRSSFACMYIPENRVISPRTFTREPLGYADENYGHGGGDFPAGPTTFDWGTGSGLAGVAYAWLRYGDAYLDVARGQGFGIDGCSVRDVSVQGNRISFSLTSQLDEPPQVLVKFAGLTAAKYVLNVNGVEQTRTGEELEKGVVLPTTPELIIHHTPLTESSSRDSLIITAVIPRAGGKTQAQVHYRKAGSDQPFQVARMSFTPAAGWKGQIPAQEVATLAPALEYYIEARLDDARAQLPDGAPRDTLKATLTPYLFADCGDDQERYLSDPDQSWVSDFEVPGQNDRVADGDQHFVYTFPIPAGTKSVWVTFLKRGECRILCGDRVLLDEGNAGAGEVSQRDLVLTDAALWASGKLSLRFQDSDPSDGWGPNIAWIKVTPVE